MANALIYIEQFDLSSTRYVLLCDKCLGKVGLDKHEGQASPLHSKWGIGIGGLEIKVWIVL